MQVSELSAAGARGHCSPGDDGPPGGEARWAENLESLLRRFPGQDGGIPLQNAVAEDASEFVGLHGWEEYPSANHPGIGPGP